MNTVKKVTVLTPNGRRQNVPITQSTTILQILDQVCSKHKFDSTRHGLKHHNKPVDLSQMFRFSGLPNNCLLEMYETETIRNDDSEILLCVQLENGNRQQGTFKSNDNLMKILENLCPENLKAEETVIVYMRHEVYGDSLRTTTLKSLGITDGRAMVRLLNKNPEELKTQAGVGTSLPIKEKESELEIVKPKRNVEKDQASSSITKELLNEVKKTKNEGSTDVSKEKEALPDEFQMKPKPDWGSGKGRIMNEKDQTMEVDNEEITDDNLDQNEVIYEIGERHAVVFSLESVQKTPDDIPDSFFELDVEDLKLILRDLRNEASGNGNAPLLTAKLRELEEDKKVLRKLSQYKSAVIRIRFPNYYVLQGAFKATENISEIYEFVRKYLQDPSTNFILFTTPPKNVMPLETTLIEADYVPTVVLHFGVEDQVSKKSNPEEIYLKEDILEKLTTPEGALFSATKIKTKSPAKFSKSISDENNKSDGVEPSTSNRTTTPKKPNDSEFKESGGKPSGKIPSWFRRS